MKDINRNTGYYNTGYYNTGDKNTGDRNTGNWNTDNYNTGTCNTGSCNTGDKNTGYCNTGDKNTGDKNTGDWNTGDRNTGSCNTGDWNTGDCNTGYCNTITPDECLIFNKIGSRKKWNNTDKPSWMFINLTLWIIAKDMSDKEKEAYPSYITTGGYLKVYSSTKEAYVEAWEKTTQEDREKTLNLPNFDDNVFKEIFGFSALENLNKCKKKMSLKDIEKELGYTIELI